MDAFASFSFFDDKSFFFQHSNPHDGQKGQGKEERKEKEEEEEEEERESLSDPPSFNLHHPFGFGDGEDLLFAGTDEEISFGEEDEDDVSKGKEKRRFVGDEKSARRESEGDEMLVVESDEGSDFYEEERSGEKKAKGRVILRVGTNYGDEEMSL